MRGRWAITEKARGFAVLHPRGGNESAESTDSIELFHAIDAVVLTSGVYRKPPPWRRRLPRLLWLPRRRRRREREKSDEDEKETHDEGGDTRTRTKRNKNKKKTGADHSTFYTSGYCIRIYYNPRIPEENDSEPASG